MAWPTLPPDVIAQVRSIFADANRAVTERLINVPNIRETSLDDGLVEAIIPRSAPTLLPSGAVVELQVHNIGGLRRLGRWETADIAVLVFVYRAGHLIGQKIGLLQSKRLYPENNDVEDDDPAGFRYGMNAFLKRDRTSALGALHRTFRFTRRSVYGALKPDDQPEAISLLNEEFGEAVYYLFYNPPRVPTTVDYPLLRYRRVRVAPIGCRVCSSAEVDAAMATIPIRAPTFEAITTHATSTNWRLETWVADLLLTCQVGQEFGGDREEIVERLLVRRTGPIGAAIAISVALSGGR